MRIAIEAALRVNEALAGWAEWAQQTDTMSDADFGARETKRGAGEIPGAP
jgi:hypothetical protein